MIVRSPAETDAEAVAAFLAECDTAEIGAPDTDADDVREQWALPGLDLARDVWIVKQNGRLAGYACAWARGGRRMHAEARVAPGGDVRAIGSALLDRIETRTREYGIATSSVFVIGSNREAKALAEERGYRLVRHYLRMVAELGEELPPVAMPPGVAIRTSAGAADERAVYELMTEAFAGEYEFTPDPYDAWRKRLVEVESFDPDLWFLAEAGGDLVGAAQCYPFLDGGWVQGLGIRPSWRRRGLGLALLVTAFAAFRARGRRRVGLEVDAENPTEAKRLYERAGMREAFRFDLYEKKVATV